MANKHFQTKYKNDSKAIKIEKYVVSPVTYLLPSHSDICHKVIYTTWCFVLLLLFFFVFFQYGTYITSTTIIRVCMCSL